MFECVCVMFIMFENKGLFCVFLFVVSMFNMLEMFVVSVEMQDEWLVDEVREAKEATFASDRGEFIEGVE